MNSPFKFLDSYTKADKDIFFGREREIEQLYQKVFESKLLLVYGISGTGKSSLIECGLANKFQESDWLPINIRRGSNINESLNTQITRELLTEVKPTASLKKKINSLYLDHFKPIYLIFDQFEELFIFGTDTEKNDFIQAVKKLVESDIQCKFIFAIREEYLANITEFEKEIPSFLENRLRIEKMHPNQAIACVEGPCKYANIKLEEGIAPALLETLTNDRNEIELTWLQVFLDKLYRSVQDEPKQFTHDLLKQMGKVSDLLGSFLEEQISQASNPDETLAILKSFVSVKGTKRQITEEEILSYCQTIGKQVNENDLKIELQSLVTLRILRDKDENSRYELRHDALASKIYKKITLVEKELMEVRQFIENAYQSYEKRNIFLNNEDLSYLEKYESNLFLTKELSLFIQQSRQKIDSKKKSFIRLTRISALVLILILASIIRTIIWDKKQSEKEKDISSLLLLSETNPIKGIYKSINLWDQDSNSNVLKHLTLNNFHNLLSNSHDTSPMIYYMKESLEIKEFESNIIKADISNCGVFIYGCLEMDKIFVTNIETKKTTHINVASEIESIFFTSSDTCLAVVFKNNEGKTYDKNGRIKYSFNVTTNELMNERLVRFFSSGNNHLAVANNESVLIYTSKGDIAYELNGHQERINSIDISPDNRFIVTASNDKKIYLWNYNNTLNKFSIYDSLIGHYDKVWSCEFSKSGKYVLSASADSMIKIWRYDGSQVNPMFRFARNLYTGDRIKFNNREPDDDIYNQEVSAYYRKMCNATFSENEYEIIATGYEYDSTSSKENSFKYNQVLFYDWHSEFMQNKMWDYYEFLNEDWPDSLCAELYSRISVSPIGNTAITMTSKNNIDFNIAGGIHVFSIEGMYPMFSNNGEEIFWIRNNKIHKIPISKNAIKKILKKFNVENLKEQTEKKFIVL